MEARARPQRLSGSAGARSIGGSSSMDCDKFGLRIAKGMKALKKARRRFTHEGRLTWLTIAAAAPAAIVALALLWFGDHTEKVQWTFTLIISSLGFGSIL